MNRFDELYINVLESTGHLTEDEKDIIVTEASSLSKGDKAVVIGTVLASIAGVSALVANLIKNKKAQEAIDAHDELKSCDELIRKSKNSIKQLRESLYKDYSKYAKLKEDSERLASLFGSKTKQVYDGFYQYDETIINRYRTEANPDYDPKKAEEWKKASEDAADIMKGILKTRKDLKNELKKLKQYNKELKKVARKYATVDPATVNRIFDSVDKSVAAIDESISEIDGMISDKSVKESVDDIKLEIYESCRSGEITEEERDLLISSLEI